MKTITVQILGKKISLEMDVEEEYLKELVKIVEKEIQEVRRKSLVLSLSEAVMIASLNLADKCIQGKKQIEKIFEERINEIIKIIEQKI